ncbi:MAG: thymidylate kinase [Candidatus Thermoplasmatota archaeon]|nr:thymidylate kinase [Candidatus Thermoplasmatota archaeon]
MDGLDGCGKDTHAQRMRTLFEAEGQRVTVISHPSRSRPGRLSKRFLEDSGPVSQLLATFFYTADVLTSVRWLRTNGEGTVIFVRYLLGSAYLPRRLAPIAYRFFSRLLPFPDLALFIDIDPEVAARRIALRGHKPEMFETTYRLAKVRAVAKELIREGWVTIDNSEDGEAPFREVERVLRERSFLQPAV